MILRFLRENPGSGHLAIARAVGLATYHNYSSSLADHLMALEARGAVRQFGRKWESLL